MTVTYLYPTLGTAGQKGQRYAVAHSCASALSSVDALVITRNGRVLRSSGVPAHIPRYFLASAGGSAGGVDGVAGVSAVAGFRPGRGVSAVRTRRVKYATFSSRSPGRGSFR